MVSLPQGRRDSVRAMMLLLLGLLVMVEGVPTLPRADADSSSLESAAEQTRELLPQISALFWKYFYFLKTNVDNNIKGLIGPSSRTYTIEADSADFYKLVGLDGNVEDDLRNFPFSARPASMLMFEHQGLLFWMVTEVFDANVNIPSLQTGRVHIYALNLQSQKLQTVVVDTYGASRCEVVLKGAQFVEFVCAERLGDLREKMKNGSGVYRLTWRDSGLTVTHQRYLSTHAARDVLVWTDKENATYLFLMNTHRDGDDTEDIKSFVFRQQTTQDGSVHYSSYDSLESTAFASTHARGMAGITIGTDHYLAVANYMGDDGNTETYSEIFVFEPSLGTVKLLQRIRTRAATDWTAFTFRRGLNAEHFLVVANEHGNTAEGMKNNYVDSVIYKFNGEKFVPFQCIATSGAKQWSVLQGPNGEFVLAVNNKMAVFFYQYNGWRFVKTFEVHFRSTVESLWMGFLPNTLNRFVLTVVLAHSQRPHVMYLNFQLISPTRHQEEALKWCVSKLRGGGDLQSVVARVRTAPRRDQPISFTRPFTISGNLRLAGSSVTSTIGSITVRDEAFRVDHSFTRFTADVEQLRLGLLRLARARTVLATSVTLDRPNLDGFLFNTISVQCSGSGIGTACRVQNLIANEINGISSSLDGVVLLRQEQRLQSLNVSHAVVGAGVSAAVTFLSGTGFPRTRTSDLITLSGDHTITGQKDFAVIKTNSMEVSGTVASVRVDGQNILLTNEQQTFTADVTVSTLSAQHFQLQTLNGRDFTSFVGQLVLNNTNTRITGNLVVGGDVVANAVRTTLPSTPLDPRDVAARALLHNSRQTQVITGLHTLGGLSVQGGLRVIGLLNGVSVPRDVYLRSRDETVRQHATFRSIRADSVRVTVRLGDVKVVNGELDIVLHCSDACNDQVVSGRKVFTELTLLTHSSVSLNVSGYRLQDLQGSVVDELIQEIESGRALVGDVRFEAGVQVLTGVVGDANITRIIHDAIPLHATSISSIFIFDAPVKVVGDLLVRQHLNGRRIDQYALLAGTHVFSGDVTFSRDIVVEGNVRVDTTVNGINLSELSGVVALRDSVAQTVVQDITLHNPEFRGGLRVTGSLLVAGIDLDDVVLLDQDAEITGVKIFSSVTVGSSVTAGQVVVSRGGTVDGVVLEDIFFGNSLRKSGGLTQQLVGRSLNVVIASSISGTGLRAFERSVVYRNAASARLAGSLTFTGPVRVQDLTFGRQFDGVSAEDYKSAWLVKSGDQVLTGLLVIQNVDTLELTFTGRSLQGVDFERLVKNTAKIDEVTVLRGVAFGNVVSNGEVAVNGTVQGWRLMEEAVVSSARAQTITGRKVFQAGVHYMGDFSVGRFVVVRSSPDDPRPLAIDVERFCAALSRSDALTSVRQWTIQGAKE